MNLETTKGYAYQEGIVSCIFNFLLGGGKIVFGFLSGSISVVADGFHSLSDMLSSLVVIFGVKLALKPADKEHPFGHGRLTSIANFIMAVMLIFIGFEFLKTSVSSFFNPHKVMLSIGLFAITIFSIISKEVLARYSMYLYKKSNIEMLKTDAYHHRSDSLSSVVVLAGLIGNYYNMYILDPIIGFVIGVLIIRDGVGIIRKEISRLLGYRPCKAEIEKIISIATSVEGVKGVHSIIINSYELTKIVSFHIEVDSKMSFEDAHMISDIVEDILRAEGYYPTIHIDPVDDKDFLISEIKKIVEEKISSNYSDLVKSFHSIKIKRERTRKNSISFTISFNDSVKKETETKIKTELKELLNSKLKNIGNIEIEIEPLFFY